MRDERHRCGPRPGDEQAGLPVLAPARTHGELRDYLFEVLTTEQYEKLPDGTVEAWKTSDVVFDAVAHWARVAKARLDSEQRAQRGEDGIPGLYIPKRLAMPQALSALINGTGKGKGRKGRGKP